MSPKLILVVAGLLVVSGCETDSVVSGNRNSEGTTQERSAKLPEPVPGDASLVGEAERFKDRILFSFDSSELQPKALATLDSMASWLDQNRKVSITIEGHGDERGTRDYNLALGERRAHAVRDYLIALGTNPGRMTTLSYGAERPAVPGSNELAWAQNRRSVFVIQ